MEKILLIEKCVKFIKLKKDQNLLFYFRCKIFVKALNFVSLKISIFFFKFQFYYQPRFALKGCSEKEDLRHPVRGKIRTKPRFKKNSARLN